MNLEKIRQFLSGKKSIDTEGALVDKFLAENKEAGTGYWCVPKDREAGREILSLPRGEQAAVLEVVVARMADLDERTKRFRKSCRDPRNPHHEKGWDDLWYPRQQLNALAEAMLRKKLPLTADQLTRMTRWLAGEEYLYSSYCPIVGLVGGAENFANEGGEIGGELEANLKKLLELLQRDQRDETVRKCIQRLQKLTGGGLRIPLQKGEVWSEAATGALEEMMPEKREVWIALLAHCAMATGAKPTQKWAARARELVEEVGRENYAGRILEWFPLVDKPRPDSMTAPGPYTPHPLMICDMHGDILRGLVWACENVANPEIHRALTALALSSYKKVPGFGPRLTKVGNACIAVLGAVGGLDAIGQLAILKVRVKFGTAQAMLEKALDAAAEKEGLPREEIEEMSVPAYGLTEIGSTTMKLGDSTVEVVVAGNKSVDLIWKNREGKVLKSVPAAVKGEFTEDLKEVRQMQKDIERMLGAQAERLDQLFLMQKSWPLAVWRERYLDHPLVGVLARRLIWNVHEEGDAMPVLWNGDHLEALDGRTITPKGEAKISVWHPLDSVTADVQAWREKIEGRQIRQPFKQAHREIYVLTPAEENTRVYSNRFAAHILKQHQFNALCGQRGWKNKLRLMVDAEYPPACRVLDKWNLRAEFWIEGAGTEYGSDTNDAGAYLYLSTDQVRFYENDAPTRMAHAGGGGYRPTRGQEDVAVELQNVPPLVFSEIMRDVDLFVGVCSAGNDPTWADGGPGGRYRDYWRDYSFGELSGNATTRREILGRLLPRLKIAGKCSLSERFLVVRGTLHEYKIHLGSGNILMSPDDRYLCIVAKQSVAAGKQEVFLPFEGDQMMAVILSKAFLLANDTAITDPTIVQQIK